ncbi:ABC transporter ATP-binding protein [Candidatus Formimonas warabiya]|uniref:ABC transporter domain-containing protein n=1 Tax=Formimonas warabiya TaxID=1761012 RepID=A0A3G1KWU3_FORW1|nr:ABC transporter ATP-binding protein [Candidatus Formimonas warabiya]ATW26890.1 hypothetical protein DCMF_20885 [Candidatus Formimonas warabiya]
MANLLDIKIDSLCFPGTGEPVLKNINLPVAAGEFIVLAGPSGAGKSVLLSCLAGVIPLYKKARLHGAIQYRGQSITRLPELAGKIGLVTDNPQNQLFCTTVEEDLAFGPCSMLLPPEDVRRRIKDALDFVFLPGYQPRKPETLSGGEMQRVVLASVLAMNPEILLLDRPADQLDPKGRKEIYQRLHRLSKVQGKTIIVIEETWEDVMPLADRFWGLNQGNLVYDLPNTKTVTISSLREKWGPVKGMPKTGPKAVPVQEYRSDALPALEVRDLYLRYENGGFALHNLTLNICPGEFVALMGENGAGKTTLTKTFNGLLRPQKGSVTVNGLDTQQHTTAQLSLHLGYLFQNPLMQVCCNSVEEEIAFALKVKKYPKDQIAAIVKKTIQEFGLEQAASLHPYRLSRGMLQKAALASVLVANPGILVVDEPTSNMSYEEARDALEIIDRYNKKGTTVIMITHHLKFALEFCRRFLVMKNGGLILDTDTGSLAHHQEIFADLGFALPEISGRGGNKHETALGL